MSYLVSFYVNKMTWTNLGSTLHRRRASPVHNDVWAEEAGLCSLTNYKFTIPYRVNHHQYLIHVFNVNVVWWIRSLYLIDAMANLIGININCRWLFLLITGRNVRYLVQTVDITLLVVRSSGGWYHYIWKHQLYSTSVLLKVEVTRAFQDSYIRNYSNY